MRVLQSTCFATLGLALAAAIAATPVQAAVATNGSLVDGVYFGTGNVDGGWTVSTDNGYEIALRAKLYRGAVITPDLSGVSYTNHYTVSTGMYSPTRALWNWEYSIYNTNTGGNLAGLTADLRITDGTTSSGPYNLMLLDNAVSANGQGVQNSENMIFPFFPGYSPWAGKTYTFTLDLHNGEASLVSDTIDVSAVPEPASMVLLSAGLVGLAGLRRRRA